MNNSINNTVCIACGAIKNLQNLSRLYDDPMCSDCRQYQQMMIQQRVTENPQKNLERRKQYFKHLETE